MNGKRNTLIVTRIRAHVYINFCFFFFLADGLGRIIWMGSGKTVFLFFEFFFQFFFCLLSKVLLFTLHLHTHKEKKKKKRLLYVY